MSFLSDLFEGRFSNLGTDISHAPESAVQDYRSEWVPALAAGGALLTGGLLAPELLGGAAAADLGIGGAEAGLSAADAEFGAFSPDLFAANEAAAGILPEGVDLGTAGATGGAADLFAGDVGGAGAVADASGGAVDASGGVVDASQGFASLAGDPNVDTAALGFQPVDAAGNLTQDAGAQAINAASPVDATAGAATADTATSPAAADAGYAKEVADLSGASPGTSGGTAAGNATAAAKPGFFQSVGNYFADPSHDVALALGAAPLALALGMGQPTLGTAGQQANQQGIAMSQEAQAALTQARAGVLNPGQQAYIDQYVKDQTNQWRQTLFNMGVTDPSRDTRWAQIQGMIQQKALAQTATFIQNNMSAALQEAATAATLLTSISQQQMQSQSAFTSSLVNASTALAKAIPTGGTQKVQIVNA